MKHTPTQAGCSHREHESDTACGSRELHSSLHVCLCIAPVHTCVQVHTWKNVNREREEEKKNDEKPDTKEKETMQKEQVNKLKKETGGKQKEEKNCNNKNLKRKMQAQRMTEENKTKNK